MRHALALVPLMFLFTCTMEVVDQKDAGRVDATVVVPAPAPLDPEQEEEVRRMLAEQDEIVRRLHAGDTLPGEEPISDLSAYQRVAVEKTPQRESRGLPPAWLLLARQTFSEGINDMKALLQMDLNLADKWGVSLARAIARRAGHATGMEEATRQRQRGSATMPARGKEPGELWLECDEIVKVELRNGRVRWRGLPEGCHGKWKQVYPRWNAIRKEAKEVIRTRPHVVKGHVIDQGGIMDLADYLKKNPHMCLLDSPGTSNFFFGRRSDPRNTCITPTLEQLAMSKKVAKQIRARDKRRGEGRYAKTVSVEKMMKGLRRTRSVR